MENPKLIEMIETLNNEVSEWISNVPNTSYFLEKTLMNKEYFNQNNLLLDKESELKYRNAVLWNAKRELNNMIFWINDKINEIKESNPNIILKRDGKETSYNLILKPVELISSDGKETSYIPYLESTKMDIRELYGEIESLNEFIEKETTIYNELKTELQNQSEPFELNKPEFPEYEIQPKEFANDIHRILYSMKETGFINKSYFNNLKDSLSGILGKNPNKRESDIKKEVTIKNADNLINFIINLANKFSNNDLEILERKIQELIK